MNSWWIKGVIEIVKIGIFLFVYIYISKYAYGIEMPNNNSDSSALILKDVLKRMGIPKAIASDDGGEFKGRFKEILDAEGIDHIIMTTHLSFIDRFTRTITNMLFERIQHTGKDWHRLLPNIINRYNNSIPNSSKLKPVDAIQNKGAVEVKTNLMLRARFKRKYEEMHVVGFRRNFKKNKNTRR